MALAGTRMEHGDCRMSTMTCPAGAMLGRLCCGSRDVDAPHPRQLTGASETRLLSVLDAIPSTRGWSCRQSPTEWREMNVTMAEATFVRHLPSPHSPQQGDKMLIKVLYQ
jgi:hypothetical protein